MNLKEAYLILELSSGASREEAKKKYKELAKKWHPDVNKDPEAEAKFKKINEAYQCVENGKGNQSPARQGWNPFSGIQNIVEIENIQVYLTIDFKDSILGCKKEIKYSRKTKCPNCDGQGSVRQDNGCKKCGGKGQVTVRQSGMVMISTCPDCQGRVSMLECQICHTHGCVHTDASVSVSIPPGVSSGNILKLQGMGNYVSSFMGFADQYTDTLCHIGVTPEPGLTLEGRDVVCHITMPLLDALRGCTRSIKTIFGNKDVYINPKSRNRDEVIIPHLGVAGVGNQRVILDVQYPPDTSQLVDALIVMMAKNNGVE